MKEELLIFQIIRVVKNNKNLSPLLNKSEFFLFSVKIIIDRQD